MMPTATDYVPEDVIASPHTELVDALVKALERIRDLPRQKTAYGETCRDEEMRRIADAALAKSTLTRAKAAPVDAWWDIASDPPPKDGTLILACKPIDKARYPTMDRNYWFVKQLRWSAHFQDGYEDGWREEATGNAPDMNRFKWCPTKWQLLPPPPSTTQGDAEGSADNG